MEIIKRVGKSLDNLYGVEYADKVKIKSPTILCLSGDGTRNTKQANGFAKTVMTRLGVGESQLPYHASIDNFNVYSVNYEGISMVIDGDYARQLYTSYLGLTTKKPVDYKAGNEIERTVDALYERFFKGMIFDDSGRIYSAQQISKNFTNLTVVDFCAGSVIMLGIEQKIYQDLKQHGFKEGQCVEIMKNLCTISTAPLVPIGMSRTSSVYLASAADTDITGMYGRQVQETEIVNSELESLAQYAKVKSFPNNTCLVACNEFGGGVEEHYSENYTTESDVDEEGRKLQLCFTKALSTMYARKGLLDVKALAEDMEKMMSGDYETAKSYALSSLKKVDVKQETEDEWQFSVKLSKKYSQLASLTTDIRNAMRTPLNSNVKLSINISELMKLNSPCLKLVNEALDLLRKANKESNKQIQSQKEQFAKTKFANESDMIDFYKTILESELQKWRMNASVIAAINELARATQILERGLPSAEEEQLAIRQYSSIEKFFDGQRYLVSTNEQKLKTFIKEQTKEESIINE